eukprot:CAMPEP_0171194636 /NCGR_PEP_ID=MMETSP0790-20130122/20990_1 /TAXON_ID=2925 /ORGANISM="Alexandrium catenella, Strain OF101" /LENGTH=365 /DNA_ID=CAMNT_0011659837 /DNA_START=1 /DNA_END=1095 /DNA_ORIENTATION=+
MWWALAPDFEKARAELRASRARVAPARAAPVSSTPALPGVLSASPFFKVEDLCETREDAASFAWKVFGHVNERLFGGELELDGVRFLADGDGGSELEEDGGEAALQCRFVVDSSCAELWVEFVWSRARTWTLSRLASVLLHELVHAWHDSRHWPAPAQLAEPHSEDFLKKCVQVGEQCEREELPLFPNVLTESWALLADSDLEVLVGGSSRASQAWEARLNAAAPFEGHFSSDLLAVRVKTQDILAAKHRINAVNVAQALELGYEGLRAWRRHVAKACVERVHAAESGAFVCRDYTVVSEDLLQRWAEELGLAGGGPTASSRSAARAPRTPGADSTGSDSRDASVLLTARPSLRICGFGDSGIWG